ncbi:MAG: glycosyltransferase family 4 protein [Armatimonadetes bacterium]|nr:glycosyltransferase family 4 protein [Armatimonadota bacterium]
MPVPGPLRILYMAFDPVPFPKGAARRIEATVRALARTGATVHLLTPRAPGSSPFPDRLTGIEGVEHAPVSVLDGGDNFLDRALFFRRAAAERIGAQEWDVLWYRSPWEGLPAIQHGTARKVYEAHGFPSVELPSHYPRLLARDDLMDRLALQEIALLRHSDRLVTPSRTGRSFLIGRGVDPARIRLIPNSVDPQEFPPPDQEPAPGPPWRLAYLGTLAPWQGLFTLLEALSRLKGRVDVRLHLAGTRKGPWLRQVRRAAQKLRVRSMLEFHGPQDSAGVRGILQQSHICVAPLPDDPRNSLQGCCPIKILEYMAAGRAVLSTRIRPVEEVVRHGATGWLVRPGSPYALAEGIRHLAAHPEEAVALGLAAREDVTERFHRRAFEERLAAMVSELAPYSSEDAPLSPAPE